MRFSPTPPSRDQIYKGEWVNAAMIVWLAELAKKNKKCSTEANARKKETKKKQVDEKVAVQQLVELGRTSGSRIYLSIVSKKITATVSIVSKKMVIDLICFYIER